ncbi:hypothetical protein CHO01_27150 [Cellulomonas hominis]|uniref:Uncharacterized protein n=1 Tax=Cellulomonas hominis TaxID=156981 RepID=A0A511FEB5_9CELL|nr:hypothetical protein CHO01_27150 [Cellulomonas hominis]
MPGREGHPVDDGVELALAEGGADGGRVADVGVEHLDAVRDRTGGAGPAVQEGDVEAALDGQTGACGADDAGAADEEDAKGHGAR